MDLLPPSFSCWGIYGRPVETGDPVPLAVDSGVVEAANLSGDIVLESSDPGVWGVPALHEALFEGDPVTVRFSGGDNDGEFPSFERTVTPPDPMVMIEPDPTASEHLLDMLADTLIWWEAGNGDYVEIEIRPVFDPGDDTVWTLVCYTFDDGCHVVPAEAIGWLTSVATAEYTIEVSRVRFSVEDLTAVVGEKVLLSSYIASWVGTAH
jgi:hypothetical protein